MSSLLLDLRTSFRFLSRRRAATAVALLTLALATLAFMQVATLAPAWRGLQVNVRRRLAGD